MSKTHPAKIAYDIRRYLKYTPLTREGKAKLLRRIRHILLAESLLNELCQQIRPTTRISSRAYAAERVVEEWQGPVGIEIACDDNEWLAASATALGLCDLRI